MSQVRYKGSCSIRVVPEVHGIRKKMYSVNTELWGQFTKTHCEEMDVNESLCSHKQREPYHCSHPPVALSVSSSAKTVPSETTL